MLGFILGLIFVGVILGFIFLPLAWAIVVLLAAILVGGTLGFAILMENLVPFK